MNPKVEEFLAKAREEAQKKELEQRRQHLIELGLIGGGPNGRTYSVSKQPGYEFDSVKALYYKENSDAIDITDEEYAEILKVAPIVEKAKKPELDNGAESTLSTINTLFFLVIVLLSCVSIILGIADGNLVPAVIGILGFLGGLISYTAVKVMLNISNNLHEINAKLK